MIRRIVLFLVILASFSSLAFSQGAPQYTRIFNFTSATNSAVITPPLGISYWRLKYEVLGSASACTVSLLGSQDTTAFGNTLIAGTTCTSDGQTAATSVSGASSYLKVSVSSFTASTVGASVNIILQGWNLISSSSGNNIISTATTYYVCAKALGGNCAYNGDGGQAVNAACPSDTCSGTSKTTPLATIAGAFTKITNKIPLALITIQLADTAGTGTDCYTPNNTTLNLPSYQAPVIWPGSAMLSGLADAYPNNYVYLLGNSTTPANVMINGSGACSTRTMGTSNGLTFQGGIVRVRGMKFQGYGDTGNSRHFASNAVSGLGTLLYGEDITCVGDEDLTAAHGGVCFGIYDNGILKTGGTWLVTNTGWVTADNAVMHSTSPLNSVSANTTLTYTNVNTSQNEAAVNCLERAMCYFDHFTASWFSNAAGNGSGAGNYQVYMANLFASVIYAEWYGAAQCPGSSCLTQTINAASITYEAAMEGGFIDLSCVTGSQSTCTLTSGPSINAYSDRFSMVAENAIANGTPRVFNFGCTNNWVGVGTAPITICGDDGLTAVNSSVQLYGAVYITTHLFTKGTIAAINDVVCFVGNNQVGDCPTSAVNPIGVSVDANTQPNILAYEGSQILVNLDGSTTPSAGWFACTSATVAGKATAQSGACAAGRQVGIVRAGFGAATTAQIIIQFK